MQTRGEKRPVFPCRLPLATCHSRRVRPMKPERSHEEVVAQRRASLSRRRFLRGVGVSLALPAFESLIARGAGASGLGAAGSSGAGLPATTPTGAPLRMAFVYVPNGVNLTNWWP